MKIKEISKNENGSAAVEASIVVPVVLMIICVMMYLGFIMYQRTVLTVIANETASSIGQIYSTNSKDPFIGFTTPQKLGDTIYYRALYNAAGNALENMVQIHGTMDSEAAVKSNWYAQYRITSSRLYKQTGDIRINTEFERPPGTLMQKNVKVIVMATYDLPFIRFFGITDSTVEVSAVGKAQCFDILDYGSTMSLASTLAKDIIDPFSEKIQEFFAAIDTVVGMISSSGHTSSEG